MRRRPLALALLMLALPNCDDPGGGAGGDSSGDSSDSADTLGDTGTDARPDSTGADGDVGSMPAWTDDEALLAWLGAIVAACPPASLSTAPVEWQMTMITEEGCTVRHPEAWRPDLVPGGFEVTSDATRHVGYSIVATYLPGIDWTEVTLGEHILTALRDEYPDLSVLAAESSTDPYGLGVRFRVIALKFELDGTRSLGVVKVLHYGCSAVLDSCPLTASLTWAPAAELPTWACTLAQIEATLRCPSGGGTTCDEGDCDASCRAEGAAGGTCVGDSCMCH